MNDLTITVTGWVATEPALHDLGGKGKMCAFRLAHTARYRNGDGAWVDGSTEWFSVRMFRGGSQNVSESIHKGQPIVVHGRVKTSTWTGGDGVERTELQIDAITVGHDLTKGVARFSRTVEASASSEAEDDAQDAAQDAAGDESASAEDVEARDAAAVEAGDVEDDALERSAALV